MGDGRWRGLLSVYSFNQPLWRYGRRGLGGGGGGGGIVGEEGRPLASCFLHASLYFYLSFSHLFFCLYHFICLFLPLTPCLDLGDVEIPHGDAENMNEVYCRSG